MDTILLSSVFIARLGNLILMVLQTSMMLGLQDLLMLMDISSLVILAVILRSKSMILSIISALMESPITTVNHWRQTLLYLQAQVWSTVCYGSILRVLRWVLFFCLKRQIKSIFPPISLVLVQLCLEQHQFLTADGWWGKSPRYQCRYLL